MIDNLTPEQERKLRIAYVQTFGTDAGQQVLKDLGNRCFKINTTYIPEVNMVREEIFINEGKRQVLLHIENMMSDEDIQRLARASGKGV